MVIKDMNTEISPEAVAKIKDADLLIRRFGRWPSFVDTEIVRLEFDRGNLIEIFKSKDWDKQVSPSLTATFFVFDEMQAHDSPLHKNTLAKIKFEFFDRFLMEGFNYQNPVLAVSINLGYSERLKKDIFTVAWGGTAIQHDVSFACENITVVSVVPL